MSNPCPTYPIVQVYKPLIALWGGKQLTDNGYLWRYWDYSYVVLPKAR